MNQDQHFAITMIAIVFFFSISAIVNYSTEQKIKELHQSFSEHVDQSKKNDEALSELTFEHSKWLADIDDTLNKKSKKLSILEESIEPENKRWAKIKRVRDAVKTYLTENGKSTQFNIKDLTKLSGAIVDYSELYDVDISLVLSMISQESAYNQYAVSSANAKGLMQLIPPTAKECANDIGKKYYNIFKIRDNIQLGTWYIRKMLDRFNNDVKLAVMAYNCGPTCVDMGYHENIEETKDYVKRILGSGEEEGYIDFYSKFGF